ncbi:hypothetical protein COR50_20865 [Chitinophaga caeni]|uniref:Organic solvent tolerance-like N-terminal domain-containing protein n=1 Tax=Chitinophaga caeni TaxID=2029983 RepID=A0A291QZH6_9BACT|nr:OstA-like protein [Chitinophaga caeni]ATL49429.1 hypothetical protein COR50_20865 [Chitinophaga caeni]
MLKKIVFGILPFLGLALLAHFMANAVPGVTPGEYYPPQEDTSRKIHVIGGGVLRAGTDNEGKEVQIVVPDAIFRQGTTLLYCDSAVFYEKANMVKAFGNVHINQADSIHIYSDLLNYNGNDRIATVTGNAKLTDGKTTITGPELAYDMNARMGSYTKSGRLTNEQSILTSEQGYYYADTKDVHFVNNVLLEDPEYTLSTDELWYNTETKVSSIVAPTTIYDGKTTMYATSGTYNTEAGLGDFTGRPIIEDSTSRLTANSVQMDKASGRAYAIGNMVWRDTAQKISVLANLGTVDQNAKSLMATQKPVMLLEGQDTIFIAADTLFSAPTKPLVDSVKMPKDSTTGKADSNKVVKMLDSAFIKKDSTAQKIPGIVDVDRPDSTLNKQVDTSLDVIEVDKSSFDSLLDKVVADTSRLIKRDTLPVKDTAISTPGKPDVKVQHFDERNKRKSMLFEEQAMKPLLDTNNTIEAAPDTAPVQPADTATYRFIKAYHDVKIFSDSLQGVADSVYYTTKDSAFRLYHDPILWSKEFQMFGDTVVLYTKNKKADRVLLDQNAMIINSLGFKDIYNQVKGQTIWGYFSDNKLDSMYVNGNAEAVYYLQDSDSAFISLVHLKCAMIKAYFEAGELERIVFIKEPDSIMDPFTQRTNEHMFLPGFKWEVDRRPKSKYELIGQ